MATFSPGIPLATDLPSQSQQTIADNFTALNDQFSIDHDGLVVNATGFHKKITLPQGADVSTPLNTVTLYSKIANARSTLFMRQENNGTAIQMSGPNPVVAANGATFLPGGLLLQWGSNTGPSGTVVTFPIAFSAAAYSITFAQAYSGGTVRDFIQTEGIGAASFTIRRINTNGQNDGAASTVFWMAVGPI